MLPLSFYDTNILQHCDYLSSQRSLYLIHEHPEPNLSDNLGTNRSRLMMLIVTYILTWDGAMMMLIMTNMTFLIMIKD